MSLTNSQTQRAKVRFRKPCYANSLAHAHEKKHDCRGKTLQLNHREEKCFFLTRVAVTTSKHVQLHTTDHDVPSIELEGHRSLNGAHCWNA
jgi:hypothetical protein